MCTSTALTTLGIQGRSGRPRERPSARWTEGNMQVIKMVIVQATEAVQRCVDIRWNDKIKGIKTSPFTRRTDQYMARSWENE